MKVNQLLNPLLSIIIPTRNRCKYASKTIKAILDIPSDKFELVIQDNSDSNELIGAVGDYAHDVRLRYEHDPSTLSMGENFDKAIYRASGEFTCCMGDDDTVSMDIVAVCEWAKTNNLDAILDNWRVSYYWPDFGGSGELRISKFSGKAKLLDPELELKRCVISGGVGMQRLPRVYLGLVRRSCLMDAMEKIKGHQAGLSPDMYLTVSTASSLKRLCALDYPIVIAGFSAAGAGYLIAHKRHEGRLEDAFHLRARPTYQWPEVLPKFYSVHTFFAESVWEAINATNRKDLIRRFNFPFLYLVCFFLYPKYRNEIRASRRYLKRTVIRNDVYYYFSTARHLCEITCSLIFKRIEQRSMRPGFAKVEKVFENIVDTKQAASVLNDYLVQKGRTFDQIRLKPLK